MATRSVEGGAAAWRRWARHGTKEASSPEEDPGTGASWCGVQLFNLRLCLAPLLLLQRSFERRRWKLKQAFFLSSPTLIPIGPKRRQRQEK